MTGTMTPKAERTTKTIYLYVCRWDGETLVKIARYERSAFACRRKLREPGSFIVNYFVATDPDASDYGTGYFIDEQCRDLDRHFYGPDTF
jgi:hypothetical protein